MGAPNGRTAVYRLFDAADRLLYVGVGELPATRWQDHRSHKEWWPQVDHSTVRYFPTRDEALAEEARAIAAEHPLHNVMGTPRVAARRRRDVPPVTYVGAEGVPALVGAQEIAVRLGVSRQRVQQLVARPGFPPAACELAMGKAWRSEDIEAWVRVYRPELAQVAS